MTTSAGRSGSIDVLAEGESKFHPVDPDGFREYVRDHKSRALAAKVMKEKEAVSRFVADGDYLVYDCNYLMRGPSSIMREIMRQRKRGAPGAPPRPPPRPGPRRPTPRRR